MSYKFCRLYHLIHLTSIGDAAALLWSNGYCHMISGGGWWEWGNIQCTVGAYSWPGDEWSRSSVLERAYCPTSAQCPQVGAFRFSHQTLFFYEMWNAKSKLPPWCGRIKEYTLSWPERIMARSKLLFTTSCTMKCCESESAMMKEIIHEQMKMFWQNFSLQV